jgi:hypothetical protein
VSIQLAIFLNCIGHYGNSISIQSVSKCAGVSVESVVNYAIFLIFLWLKIKINLR